MIRRLWFGFKILLVDTIIARYQIKFPESFQFEIDRKTRIKQLRYEVEKDVPTNEDWPEEYEAKKEFLDS